MSVPQIPLKTTDLDELSAALISAFDGFDKLADALKTEFEDIRAIVTLEKPYKYQVSELLREVDTGGSSKVVKLLRAARRANPGNRVLRGLLDRLLPMAVLQEEVNELASLLRGTNLERIRKHALRSTDPNWQVPAAEKASLPLIMELLADYPVVEGDVHPLLRVALLVAFESAEGLRQRILNWCRDTCIRHHWSEEDLDAAIAQMQEPPWQERAVRVACCFAPQDWHRLSELGWLNDLRQLGWIDVWPLNPEGHGDESERRIKSADVILVFLSWGYVSSREYMTHAQHVQRHPRRYSASIIPILLDRIPRGDTAYRDYPPAMEGAALSDWTSPEDGWQQMAFRMRSLADPHPRRRRQVKAFCSYHSADERWVRELQSSLSPPFEQSFIHVVYDPQSRPGETRSEALRRALEEAEVVLILLSAEYVDSDESYQEELSTIMSYHAQGSLVIPIYVRAVNLGDSPIGQLQPLNLRPIVYGNAAAARLGEIVEGLRALIDRIALGPPVTETAKTLELSTLARTTPRKSAIEVAIAAAAPDGRYADSLKRHLAFLRRSGTAKVVTVTPDEPLPIVEPDISTLLVVLCSRALTPAMKSAVSRHVDSSSAVKRVVPVVLDDITSVPGELWHLSALPTSKATTAQFEDSDRCWASISTSLAKLVARLEKGSVAGMLSTPPPQLCLCAARQDEEHRYVLASMMQPAFKVGALSDVAELPGDDVLAAARQADLVAILLSEHFVASRACMEQAEAAISRHLNGEAIVVAVRLDRTEMPPELAELPQLSTDTPPEKPESKHTATKNEEWQELRDEWWNRVASTLLELRKLTHLVRSSRRLYRIAAS